MVSGMEFVNPAKIQIIGFPVYSLFLFAMGQLFMHDKNPIGQ